MSDTMAGLLVALLVILLGVSFWLYYFFLPKSFLHRWADENGYRVIHWEHRSLCQGPFSGSTSRNQVVLYVVVFDTQGQPRCGYLRLGTWWLGLGKYRAEVRWVDE